MTGFITAFVAGLSFGAGLVISGMVIPAKVIGFLDFTGDWDMTLAFVMGGAVLVYAPLFHTIVRRKWPFAATAFQLPSARHIDARLIAGAAIFGAGWGLAGMCPGPAIVASGGMVGPALVFIGAMAVGALSFRAYDAFMIERARAVQAPTDA